MDAVSAGAGVLALVGIALRSTKSIYQVVSGIKNAPQQVQQLASAVQNLHLVLTQVSTCRAIQQPNSAADLAPILDLVKSCSEDASSYEKELKKLQISSSDNKAGKAWKKIKMILQEKDFQRMWTEVNHHVTRLGLQLDILQSNPSLDCKDKLLQFGAAISEQAHNGQKHSDILQQQSTALSSVDSNMTSLKDNTDLMHGQFREVFASVTQKLDDIPQMSATQSENVCTLLRALQDQISGLSTEIGSTERLPRRESRSLSISGHVDDTEASRERDEVLKSIARLCELAEQKEGTMFEEEAEIILDDLDKLLDSASTQLSYGSSRPHKSRKRSIELPPGGADIDCRDLKRIRGLLASTHSIGVNQGIQRLPLFKNGRITQKRNTGEIQTAHGKMIVTTNRKQYSASPDSSASRVTPGWNTIEFTASIKSILDHPQSQAILTAYFRQTATPDGWSSLTPVISVSISLPDDSPVFSLVRHGDMEGLLNLLKQGKASLRDRDSAGTPLLHYATEQPKMCQFLIENGADVDEIASDWEFREPGSSYLGTPLERRGDDSECDDETIRKKIECRRLMLNAGADPTLYPDPSEAISAFFKAVTHGATESLQLIMDLGASFIDLEERDSGISVSDAAYRHCEDDKWYNLGGYRGDLWDAVLSECGYDISEMRKGYPRRPWYTIRYSRKVFENLWQGRKEYCPYYDDPPVWYPMTDPRFTGGYAESLLDDDEEKEDLHHPWGCSTDVDEDNAEETGSVSDAVHEKNCEERTVIYHQSPPLLSSATPETDMIQLPSPWLDDTASQIADWGGDIQADVNSRRLAVEPNWEEWQAPPASVFTWSNQVDIGSWDFEPDPWR